MDLIWGALLDIFALCKYPINNHMINKATTKDRQAYVKPESDSVIINVFSSILDASIGTGEGGGIYDGGDD